MLEGVSFPFYQHGIMDDETLWIMGITLLIALLILY